MYCRVLGNPDLYRFNSDIPMGRSEETSVIPVNSTLFTQYKFVSKLVNDGNG